MCIVAVVEDEGRKEGRAMTNPGEGSLVGKFSYSLLVQGTLVMFMCCCLIYIFAHACKSVFDQSVSSLRWLLLMNIPLTLQK